MLECPYAIHEYIYKTPILSIWQILHILARSPEIYLISLH